MKATLILLYMTSYYQERFCKSDLENKRIYVTVIR